MEDTPAFVASQIAAQAVLKLYEMYGGQDDLRCLYNKDQWAQGDSLLPPFQIPSFPFPSDETKKEQWEHERDMLQGQPSCGIQMEIRMEFPLDTSRFSAFRHLSLNTIRKGIDLFWTQGHDTDTDVIRCQLKNLMAPKKLWNTEPRTFPFLSVHSPLVSFFIEEITTFCPKVSLFFEGEDEERVASDVWEYNSFYPAIPAKLWKKDTF